MCRRKLSLGALEKADLFEANILADKIRLLHEHFFVCLGKKTK